MRAWIECPLCGGVYIILRDAEHLPQYGDPVVASDFIRPDGTDYEELGGEEPCLSCGKIPTVNRAQLDFIRTGESVPLDPATTRKAKKGVVSLLRPLGVLSDDPIASPREPTPLKSRRPPIVARSVPEGEGEE